MRSTRTLRIAGALAAAVLALAGCRQTETGPIRVVTVGPPPTLVNPNLNPVGPSSALLLEAVAQGLVRFDAAGEIEPALAQSWIVSDDGRRYTFRLRRTLWARGDPVTAPQVVERLQAALSRSSRNPLKPAMGVVDRVEAMTDQVLEIRLLAPRSNFLQLLAQPELTILRNGEGAGPYRMGGEIEGALRLVPPPSDDEEETARDRSPEILLSSTSAARAITLFEAGVADLVTGGTAGDLPTLAAAGVENDRIAYDPAAGLFGLVFANAEGPLAQPALRRALAMAIDREAIVARFDVPGLRPRVTLLPPRIGDLPATLPDWAETSLPDRRRNAADIVLEQSPSAKLRLRIATPDGPGYRVVFAHIRRDWRMIGVDAVRVPAGAPADLRLIDAVAPAELASWYLRRFMCGQSAVCAADADFAMDTARTAATPVDRQFALAQADRALGDTTAYIPITSPIRWSLRSPRLNGFRTNVFARHTPTELIQPRN